MVARFKKIHFHCDEIEDNGYQLGRARLAGLFSSADSSAEAKSTLSGLHNDETAARLYAEALIAESDDPEINAVLAPERSERIPGLKFLRSQESPHTNTRSIFFEQASQSIPIFGTHAVVEIGDSDRKLVSFDADLTSPPEVPPIAVISHLVALEVIAGFCGVELESLVYLDAPTLTYFAETSEADWHLAFYFRNVPAAPKGEVEEGHRGHGLARSPRDDFLLYDYLVDAHSAEVIYYFSAQPLLDVPTSMTGIDELAASRDFHGRVIGTKFELVDPLRAVETYDHEFKDIMLPDLPSAAISHSQPDFGNSHTAGVSAHFNATLVSNFFNNVLKRNGIDDKGMAIISMVHCIYLKDGAGPDWRNAVWWNDRMWYGQVSNGSGEFDSYSRYLDVIAHELTHGITQSSSDLIYKDQSGALNESFSDIFGVIINNWYPGEPNLMAGWNWEIGPGLARGGGPLRDMSDPTKTGDPDHMDKFWQTSIDNGGVHTNSNIHNKAAYNLLTIENDAGELMVPPGVVALLYYLTLTRLTRRADFSDCLRALKSVANTYFMGNSSRQQEVRRAIGQAYQDVGIT